MSPIIDEGYIKYRIHWQSSTSIDAAIFADEITTLNYWRMKMYAQNWIGFDSKLKVGFGNISVRTSPTAKVQQGKFLISGTQTGHLSELTPQHYSLVTKYNIETNELWCEGAVKASSESLTHAAVYELNEDYQAVIHIHCKEMWLKLLHKVPTTAATVPYGTPEMAYEIQRLYRDCNLAESKIVAMAGHEDGIIAFGRDLKEAAEILISSFQ